MDLPDQTRNLNPTPAAVVAMYLYGKAYSEQRGGSMDFWDRLPGQQKVDCKRFADAVIAAHEKHRAARE